MLDLDALLQSFGDESPSGEDLQYDADFIALGVANQPVEERVIGDSVIPAEDPDYDTVARLAIELLGHTKDLRVAAVLANAALRLEGLSAFEETLRYIRRCLEDFWDSVHPQLDPDDDDDPTARVNAVLGLTDGDSVLRSLRSAPLTESRTFGRFSLRDLQAAEGDAALPADIENAPNQQTVSAAFQDTPADHLADLKTTTDAIFEHVKAISAIFDERIGALGPELDPLQKTVHDIRQRLASHLGSETAEDVDTDPSSETPDPGSPPVQPRSGGAINSPNDVIDAIDRIVEYYDRNEPSSPLPLLMNRARRLVSADFVTIMKDMAPQGVENVSLIGGLEEETE